MMNRLRRLALWALVSTPCLALAQPAGDVTLTYQGVLSDLGGRPVTGSRDVTFRLYVEAEDGDAVWTEVHVGQEILDGAFTSVLGTRTRLEPALADADALWLGVQVGEDSELTPRMRVGGAVRALWAARAGHADDVRGRDIHPDSVSVGDRLVIDAQGRWLGQPIAGVGDGGGDLADLRLDSDLDGFADWIELLVGSSPDDSVDVPADGDDDGVPDALVGPVGPRGAVGAQGLQGIEGPQG